MSDEQQDVFETLKPNTGNGSSSEGLYNVRSRKSALSLERDVAKKDAQLRAAMATIGELQALVDKQAQGLPMQPELGLRGAVSIEGVHECFDNLNKAKDDKTQVVAEDREYQKKLTALRDEWRKAKDKHEQEVKKLRVSLSARIGDARTLTTQNYVRASDEFRAKMREGLLALHDDGDYFLIPSHDMPDNKSINFEKRIRDQAKHMRSMGEIDFGITIKNHSTTTRRVVRKN
jgi:hypothetical protein